MDAVDILCAQLMRDLFAIAKFLVCVSWVKVASCHSLHTLLFNCRMSCSVSDKHRTSWRKLELVFPTSWNMWNIRWLIFSFAVVQCLQLLHCRILSPDKTEWQLISATLCGWRRCFLADQLWFMTRIREEQEDLIILLQPTMFCRWSPVQRCLLFFCNLARLQKNSHSYHRETVRIDRQWLWDHAIKFTR